MATHFKHLLVMAVVLFGCTGCLLVPIPHQRLHAYGVRGVIVNERGEPVSKAEIADPHSPEVRVESAADGHFLLPPVYGWHGGYFIGVISFSVWPDLDMIAPKRELKISAPGYVARTLTLEEGEENSQARIVRTAPPQATVVKVPIERDFLNAGTITLRSMTPE